MPKANLWFMSKLNQRIIQVRRQRNLSQANLAERLGVTRTAISHWETARSKPSTKHLESIARMLGIDANWLISGKKPASGHATTSKAAGRPSALHGVVLENQSDYGAMFDQETLRVASAYFSLNRVQRKIIRDMLKALGGTS
jgi:transcriptional regulator with XRE-family HTH domain